eukprot:7947135-Pyramimonas_sp.AAC.1
MEHDARKEASRVTTQCGVSGVGRVEIVSGVEEWAGAFQWSRVSWLTRLAEQERVKAAQAAAAGAS